MKPPDSIDEAYHAATRLLQGWRSSGAWTLAQVLEHAAQSVDGSMHGYPAPKPAWFRATVGPLAFALFERRGRMSHPLDAPIPGVPPVPREFALAEAVAHLQRSLRNFDAWQGPLQPHFAYGALSKGRYARAHLMHLADHWSEFHPGDTPA